MHVLAPTGDGLPAPFMLVTACLRSPGRLSLHQSQQFRVGIASEKTPHLLLSARKSDFFNSSYISGEETTGISRSGSAYKSFNTSFTRACN